MIVRTPTLADLRRFVASQEGRDGSTPVFLVHSTKAQAFGVCAFGLDPAAHDRAYPSLVLHEMSGAFPICETAPDTDWGKLMPGNGFVATPP